MSRTTIARRYAVAGYTDDQRRDLIGHLLSKTQPQRRIFLGKVDNFKDKDDERKNKKMLKAYIKGATVFYHGTTKREIMASVYDRDLKERVIRGTGTFEDVPMPHAVLQMYFFN